MLLFLYDFRCPFYKEKITWYLRHYVNLRQLQSHFDRSLSFFAFFSETQNKRMRFTYKLPVSAVPLQK